MGAEESAGRTTFSERCSLAPLGTRSCVRFFDFSVLIFTKEETELKGNTLEKPLSWVGFKSGSVW